MNDAIRTLQPQPLWNNFADLNNIPRASKREEKVIQFMMDFGHSLNLETSKDDVGNVIIRKPGSMGMEDHKPVVMQSHLDMVHQKNGDTNFDFQKQAIEMVVDGDWVKAKGTTLGADNGIGVASIMSILAANDIAHPPIEALFTIDEETGMTGAIGLKGGMLTGKTLLNLDTEDDTELTIGCAGAVNVSATGSYTEIACPPACIAGKLTVKGLTGGHSGMDIHKGRGNANKLINRILSTIAKSHSLWIHSIDGGGLRNAIPRESVATIVVLMKDAEAIKALIEQQQLVLSTEHKVTDPSLTVLFESVALPENVLDTSFQDKFLKAIYACPNGIYRMSPDINGLVQSSNNLAKVLVQDGKYSCMSLTRSAVDSEKQDLADAIAAAFELIGATIVFDGSYPGWTPDPHSNIVE